MGKMGKDRKKTQKQCMPPVSNAPFGHQFGIFGDNFSKFEKMPHECLKTTKIVFGLKI